MRYCVSFTIHAIYQILPKQPVLKWNENIKTISLSVYYSLKKSKTSS